MQDASAAGVAGKVMVPPSGVRSMPYAADLMWATTTVVRALTGRPGAGRGR